MINFDVVKKENIKKHISNLPQIPDHPYRLSSAKPNSLFNVKS